MDSPKISAPTGYLFNRLYNRMHTDIKRRLREIDITHPQFSVLSSLEFLTREKPFATQTAISKNAGMDVMTVCGVIHTLENRQFLKKETHPSDSRASAIFLLEKGRKKLIEARPIMGQIDAAYFGRLGHQDQLFNQLLLTIFPNDKEVE